MGKSIRIFFFQVNTNFYTLNFNGPTNYASAKPIRRMFMDFNTLNHLIVDTVLKSTIDLDFLYLYKPACDYILLPCSKLYYKPADHGVYEEDKSDVMNIR